MYYHFVLYLFCLSCNPQQVQRIGGIDVYESTQNTAANLMCRSLGDLYTGKFNGDSKNPKIQELLKQKYTYRCVLESGEL